MPLMASQLSAAERCERSGGTHLLLCLAPSLDGGTQRLPPAVDPGSDGAQLDAQGGPDLLIGKALDVTEHHGGPELGQQLVEGSLQIGVQIRVGERLPATAPARLSVGLLGSASIRMR